MLSVALTQLTAPPHPLVPPGCLGMGHTSMFAWYLYFMSGLIYLSLAYQLGQFRKEADAGIQPNDSNFPSIIVEVGDSESLGLLKFDAHCWLENMHDVRQSFPFFCCADTNFARYGLSFSCRLPAGVHLLLFQKSSFNSGRASLPPMLHTRLQPETGSLTRFQKRTGPTLQLRCTYYLRTFLKDKCLQIMVPTIVCTWTP
jgi:hypothetical protein